MVGKNAIITYYYNIMLHIQENIPLAPYSVFKIGGPARFFAVAKNKEELIETLQFAKEKNMPFFMLGAGSNVLIADGGFNGLVIKNELNTISVDEKTGVINADAGISMPRLVVETAKRVIAGLEWGVGIPGTVGGSVWGNAGAFGKEVKDVLISVDTYNMKTEIMRRYNNAECVFGYRDSFFKYRPELIIFSAIFQGEEGNKDIIWKRIKEISEARSKTQDIGAKCAGCIFKNPEWPRDLQKKRVLLEKFPDLVRFQDRATIPAGYLIDHAGIRGRQIGNAKVSPAHANYIINEGGATAGAVVQLIALTKEHIRRTYGIMLEEEIQYIGFLKIIAYAESVAL